MMDRRPLFERSLLYRYMIYSFQYVEPNIESYRFRINFVFFQVGRVIVALFICGIIVFAFYYTFATINTTNIDAFTDRNMIFVGRIVGGVWQICNYFTGLYLFYKYPYKIQTERQEIRNLCNTYETTIKMDQEFQCCRREMTKIIFAFFLMHPMVTLSKALIYFAMDGKISIRVTMLIAVALHRVLALPFLLYFVFLSRVQVIKVTIFRESIQSMDLERRKKEVVNTYLSICGSIKKTSKECHIYVVFLVAFLWFKGMAIVNIIAGNINLFRENNHANRLAIMYHMAGTVEAVCDIIIYVLVLLIISRVSSAQEKVLSTILKNRNAEFNILLDIVLFLQTQHHLESTGYNILGVPITSLKSIVFAVLASLSGFIARLLFTM